MHGENLIHRDLKPENIIIDLNTNIVTLIDFGSLTSKDRKIYLNERFGTEMFWAPEVKKEDGLSLKLLKEGKDQDEEQAVFMEFILTGLDQEPEERKHAYFHILLNLTRNTFFINIKPRRILP